MVRKLATLLAIVALLSLPAQTLGRAAVKPDAAAAVPSLPASPTDESKVPHYFGPYPNWANSQFTLPNVEVEITGEGGTGATASATVGANGAITGLTLLDGGSGYKSVKVDFISSTGSGATADAEIIKKGAVTDIAVTASGAGYTAPTVTISANGAGGGAAATAYGGIDAVTLTSGGSGYSMPTVDFDMPDGPAGTQAMAHAEMDGDGTITAVVIDYSGSGYSIAPKVVIRNGTLFAPMPLNEGGAEAAASASLAIDSIVIDAPGANYNQQPTVTISDPTGTGAMATATIANGVVSALYLKKSGSGYLTPGIRKFVDMLPGLGASGANNLGQYIPVGVPDTTTFPGADYYEIAVVEFEEQMHSDLPPTKLRGYVQLETALVAGEHHPLPNGEFGVTPPHFLGPAIVAQKDRAVRITFVNLLPTGASGDLFMPTDSTIMGSGMGPMEMMEPMDDGSVMDMVRNQKCTESPKGDMCFADNRATLHLHGGNTPWISDGTPHQWITPAGETTPWPQGVSVVNVPDMEGVPGVRDCSAPEDGCQTFYYTNQQSARLMFYHDHSWGITRLNVYAGEAAAYVITDATEQALVGAGTIPGPGETIPLVIQDRTFVPSPEQLAWQDPTWDYTRWGDEGDLWYHHVYMPAQNPGAPGGMSSFGRWMYSPWFWPPQDAKYDPIPNPYFNMDPLGPDDQPDTADDWTTPLDVPCDLDNPGTWQFVEEPFCEPPLIPGTPLISAGMEQFNDTPIVNGTAYPTVTLEPKAYRLRMLNAANDRFFNFQWYVADATTANAGLNGLGQVIGGTEVALKADEVAAAQLDPVVFPTPDLVKSPAGPDWIQIGTEGGFLAKPAIVDGQQITTWIEDPTRFDAGLVDQHSLLLAPAERADVIVDFSQFAGQTLILYNDAPAAFPARIPSYDYYTGAPDLTPVGAPTIVPGYGPNTRTIMQVKIAGTAAPAFNVSELQNAFAHKANGSGAFESGQPPIIVGQAAYNSAYGSSFAASGWCNSPSNPSAKCDGFARISEQGGDLFKFDTLSGNRVEVRIEPKAIQDETSESNFDEFGRMSAVLGVEVIPAQPGMQNTVLSGYAFPVVDMFDTSGLPRADVTVSPIATGDDGTQIWKITHNGVDTHPIHFHATDAQILNRVTWDNIIKPPDVGELGWKDTIRVSPLEDTYVAMRPIIPVLPFDFPNSIRLLSPMMSEGAWLANTTQAELDGLPIIGFAPNGDPIDIQNHYINFGAEYVYHCHILSHEEMDMMHAVSFALPPVAPSGLAYDPLSGTLSWLDNSLSETAFVVEKSTDGGGSWTAIETVVRLPKAPNGDILAPLPVNTAGETLSMVLDAAVVGDQFRIVAENTVGDTHDYSDPNLNEILPGTFAFPVFTLTSESETLVIAPPPAAPSDLTATFDPTAPARVGLAWADNSDNEETFVIERSTDGVTFVSLATVAADLSTYVDFDLVPGTTYTYQVAAANTGGGWSAFAMSNSVTIPGTPPPAAPSDLVAEVQAGPQVSLTWTDNATDEEEYQVERSTDGTTFEIVATLPPDATSWLDATVAQGAIYWYRVAAVNVTASAASDYAGPVEAAIPGPPPPVAPSDLEANFEDVPLVNLAWADNSVDETAFLIQRSIDGVVFTDLATVAANASSYDDLTVLGNDTYTYRVAAVNAYGMSPFTTSNAVLVPPDATPPATPGGLYALNVTQTSLTLNWLDHSNNEAGFTVQRAENASFSKNLVAVDVGPNVVSLEVTGLKKNTRYYFRVLAFNGFNDGLGPFPWSQTHNVTTAK